MNLRTPNAAKIVGGLSLLVVAAVGWMFVLSPQTSALAEVQTAIQDTRDQNDVLRLQLVTLQRQAEDLGETKAAAEALATKFPATADQPGLFEQVTEAAANAGIPARHVTALTPTAPVIGAPADGVQLPGQSTSADLARQTVSLSVQGSYAQTQQLMLNLEHMPRAYLVTSITLAAGAEPNTFTTTITGDMFVMPPAELPEPVQPPVSPVPDAQAGADSTTEEALG